MSTADLDAQIALANRRMQLAIADVERGDTKALRDVRVEKRLMRQLAAIRDGRTRPVVPSQPEPEPTATPSRPLPVAEETYPSWMWNGSTL